MSAQDKLDDKIANNLAKQFFKKTPSNELERIFGLIRKRRVEKDNEKVDPKDKS